MDNKALYKKINNKVQGTVLLDDSYIKWILPNDIEFTIVYGEPEGYIGVDYKNYCITHWHPTNQEIYDDIMYMNNDVYWVKKKRFFCYSKPFFIEKSKYNSLSDKKKSKYTII